MAILRMHEIFILQERMLKVDRIIEMSNLCNELHHLRVLKVNCVKRDVHP